MCGRKTLTKSKLDIIKELSIDEWDELDDWTPTYNIAPTQKHPVILQENGCIKTKAGHWGLIPFWAKEPSIASKMINARIETLHEKPSFRNLVDQQRCLIPADGYYEWRAESQGKQPYFIHLPEKKLFTFAGLRSLWKNSEDISMLTYTIITTKATDHIHHIHPRMPVTVPDNSRSDWMDADNKFTDIAIQIRSYNPDWNYYTVSPIVNNVRENHSGCLEPYTPPVQGGLFR